QRIHRRRTVLDRPYIVHAVAIDARGDGGIASCEAFPVDAGLIEFELIDAFAGGVLAHVIWAAVAGGTEFRNVGARGLALEAFRLVHGHVRIVAGTIAAMAIGAAQSVGDMDVILD